MFGVERRRWDIVRRIGAKQHKHDESNLEPHLGDLGFSCYSDRRNVFHLQAVAN